MAYITGSSAVTKVIIGSQSELNNREIQIQLISCGCYNRKMRVVILIVLGGIFGGCWGKNNDKAIVQFKNEEKGIGDQIRMILKHYQQDNPVGLPGDLVADPIDIADFKKNILMKDIRFIDVKIYGLSKFKITDVLVELASMQAFITIVIDKVKIQGFYEQKCFRFCSGKQNKFMVELLKITIRGSGKLKVGIDGKLCTEHADIDLEIETINKNFENLDGWESFIEDAVDGNFIFSIIKPIMRKEVNTNLRDQVNRKLSKLPNRFHNSIAPLDMAILGIGRQIREMKLDPFIIEDYSENYGLFSIIWSDASVTGLSSIYRNDNITLELKDNTVFAELNFAVGKIEGKTHWNILGICGYILRSGSITSSIEYLKVNVRISQSLDTRKKLSLERLHFELGNIEIKVDGFTEAIDSLVESAANRFSNSLRYQVLETMEELLRKLINMEFERIDVQKLIEENIPGIEEQAKKLEKIVEDIDEKI